MFFLKIAKDTVCIARSASPLSRRLQLLKGLLSSALGRGRLFGWKINHLSKPALILLYSEIFARECYRFTSKKNDPVILDCGANIGMATLYFKWLYPAAQITAFEPDPATFKALQNNISSNRLPGVVAHNIALGGQDTEISFHVPEAGSLMMSAVPSRVQGETLQVPCRRLSTFITGEVDLLKLDIEGMEGPVVDELADSGKLSLVREFVIEIHHNLPNSPTSLTGVLRKLEQAGFHYQIINVHAASSDINSFQDVLVHAIKIS
ncbi:MAG: FkbM family methyltransferase [Acidobacteriia bacterium]|nr:FkbM family methyltransferase [Terriglobia bacterium]